MIEVLAIAAGAAAAGAYGLDRHARAYVKRVEARWPMLGEAVAIEGAQLHVHAEGDDDAPRALLIHGASANLRELWGPLASELKENYRVLAFDRPGYGHSARPKGATALALQAKLAAGVLKHFGGAPALVIGHSFGAAVALRLAIDHPALVRAMVLIAPASHPYPGKNAWWARAASNPIIGPAFAHFIAPSFGALNVKGAVANTFTPAPVPAGYFEDAGVGLTLRPRAFRASARDVVASNKEFAAQAPSYAEIQAPAVIVTAEKDRVLSPKRHARQLAVDMPVAELMIAPGAGHMPHRVRTDLVMTALARAESMALAHAADYAS